MLQKFSGSQTYIKVLKFGTIVWFLLFIGSMAEVKSQPFNIILGRPTDHSIDISILSRVTLDLSVQYGLIPENLDHSTPEIMITAGNPSELEIGSLLKNTRYFYSIRYKPAGTSQFQNSAVHSFQTQRTEGSRFIFTIEADVHLYDKKGSENLYKICLENQSIDKPDFMIDLGDTFGDDHHPELMTSGFSDSLHRVYRPLLGNICHSIPFYFCLGNHEGEFDYYLYQSPPNNIAVWSTLWRKFYYPNPYPNTFYTGNNEVEPYGMGSPENYYAWTWGDALFVVLDVYRDQCDSSAKPKNWDWSLGKKQYDWLRSTLENNHSKFKFVFAHHTRGQGRGGINTAKYYEWGGYDGNGSSWDFDQQRPGWGKPIHQLFVDNGVSIFFQGHDHLFAREVLDGVIYQEVPMPSDSTYQIGIHDNGDAYTGDTLGGSGHLRVMVEPSCVKVDYIRAFLPADTILGKNVNRELAFSYTIGACAANNQQIIPEREDIKLFPNPASDLLFIKLPPDEEQFSLRLRNTLGQDMLISDSKHLNVANYPTGIYFLHVRTQKGEMIKKLFIQH